jgi:sensor histidine kinase regulating citrate/malate metabolism
MGDLLRNAGRSRRQAEEVPLKAGALQSAIFNSANFSIIATDAKGVIQIFNVGAERILISLTPERHPAGTPVSSSSAAVMDRDMVHSLFSTRGIDPLSLNGRVSLTRQPLVIVT